MAKADPKEPATKTDIKELNAEFKKEIEVLRQEMHEKYASKSDLIKLRDAMQEQFDFLWKEMKEGFARVHDDFDKILANIINLSEKVSSRLDNHEDRVRVLEGHTGTVAA